MAVDHSGWKFATKAIHVGQEPDPRTGATVPPVHLTTTFTQESPGKHKGYEYARSNNPTREALERCIAALEGGAAARCFSSGSAASIVVFAHLKPGDKVLAFSDVYGGTFRMLKQVFEGYGIVPVYTDDPSPAAFAKLIDDKTKLVWVESVTNPLLRVIDIAGVAKVAHAAGALLAVDNTFATPALLTPIAHGADYVVHSCTKYLGGHSDVVGGAVVVKDAAKLDRVAFLQNVFGGVPGPFDCYLLHRGLKTLSIRMRQHNENAKQLAEHFAGHAKLERVVYPLLADHPDHELATRVLCGGGGMVTIVFKGGRDAAYRFCENLKVFALAESLGGVESLCCHPAVMTHASIPKEIRERRGVTDGLVRLSVGIEDVGDLIADVEQAMGKA
jgi:cystathionine beta-lyase/cystathionine gamma-synthase